MSLQTHAFSKFGSRFFDSVVAKNESKVKKGPNLGLLWFGFKVVAFASPCLRVKPIISKRFSFALTFVSFFSENLKMSSRSPVTYTRSPTQHDKDDPVVIKVQAFCKFTS